MKFPNNKENDDEDIELERKEIAEKHLHDLLDKVCQSVDLRLSEWNVDKDLFLAIINSPKAKARKKCQAFVDYDRSYLLLKKLNIRIPAKYRWFTNITQHTQ
jgi:hypothetical protein